MSGFLGEHYHKYGLDLFGACEQGLVKNDDYKGFLKLNVLKYVLRFEDKGGYDDLRKAEHYLSELMKLCKEEL